MRWGLAPWRLRFGGQRSVRGRRGWRWWALLAGKAVWFDLELAVAAWANWHFTEQSAAVGLLHEHHFAVAELTGVEWSSGGAASGDYDGDGFIDLYVVSGDAAPNRLFRNQGDGTFEEVGQAAGVAVEGQISVGPSFVDFDGDGHLDLFVGALVCPQKTGFCDGTTMPRRGRARLFRNRGDGTFADVTDRSGLRFTRDVFSASWADFDNDGDLDLFVTHWGEFRPPGSSEHLWRNNGDGTFTDVSVAVGLTAAYTFDSGDIGDLSFTGNFADLDGDGWLDLLVAGDFRQSKVFRNRGGAFEESTGAVISDENGMGAAVGDYDNDGDLDWFVSSIWDPDQNNDGNNWYVSGNRLYRNRGDGTFEDVTDLAGVRQGFWGWGATFADLNNDGWLDLFHVNGWRPDDPAAHEFHHDPSVLFVNQRDGTFIEQARPLGVDDRGQGRAVVAFDLERDGDLDLFVANLDGPARLYRNESPPGHFLSVRLRGAGANREAIGARIWVRTNRLLQMRELRCGNNFVSQDPAEAHFGLGEETEVEELRVRWPNGNQGRWGPLPANAWVIVDEANGQITVQRSASPTPPMPPTPTPPQPGSQSPQATKGPVWIASATPSPSRSATPSPTLTQPSRPATETATAGPEAWPCVGDCNGDREVMIDEILVLVNLVLGTASSPECPALRQGEARPPLDISDIVRAVNHALLGCESAGTTHAASTGTARESGDLARPSASRYPPFSIGGHWCRRKLG